MLTEAYSKVLLNEGISEKNVRVISKWIEELGTHKAAYKLISKMVEAKVGLGLEDLADTVTVADHVEGISDLLSDKNFEEAFNQAKDAVVDILEDEGYDEFGRE